MPPSSSSAKFEFSAVDRRYEVLKSRLKWVGPPVDELLSGQEFYDTAERVLRALPFIDEPDVESSPVDHTPVPEKPDAARLEAIRTVLGDLYDRRLGSEALDALCWRLAAGWRLLERGRPLCKTFEVGQPLWMPLQVLDCAYGRPTIKGKPTLELEFRVYGGRYGGLTFKQRMPYKFVLHKLSKDLGLPRYSRAFRGQIVGFRLAGLLSVHPKYGPRVDEFHAPGGALAYNSRVRALRELPCLREYEWGCHECPVGYAGTDGCPRATHSRAYVRQDCRSCGRSNWFDPAAPDEICLECRGLFSRRSVRLAP